MNETQKYDVQTLTVGEIDTNCYIITHGDDSIIVDPGDEAEKIIEAATGKNVRSIICTHLHHDHIGAVREVRDHFKIPFLIGEHDAPYLQDPNYTGAEKDTAPKPDKTLKDGEVVTFGDLKFKVFEFPGHTPGGIGLLNDAGQLFIGDTLFKGSVGRTDFTGGDMALMAQSVQKLLTFDDNTVAYCGHGPMTTIGNERDSNPFFIQFS